MQCADTPAGVPRAWIGSQVPGPTAGSPSSPRPVSGSLMRNPSSWNCSGSAASQLGQPGSPESSGSADVEHRQADQQCAHQPARSPAVGGQQHGDDPATGTTYTAASPCLRGCRHRLGPGSSVNGVRRFCSSLIWSMPPLWSSVNRTTVCSSSCQASSTLRRTRSAASVDLLDLDQCLDRLCLRGGEVIEVDGVLAGDDAADGDDFLVDRVNGLFAVDGDGVVHFTTVVADPGAASWRLC